MLLAAAGPPPTALHCTALLAPARLQVLFIDEVSMLSAELLQAMDFYLTQVSQQGACTVLYCLYSLCCV